MRLEAVQQSGEVVLSMLQRDLRTAAPAVVRAIDRVGRWCGGTGGAGVDSVWLAKRLRQRGCHWARS